MLDSSFLTRSISLTRSSNKSPHAKKPQYFKHEVNKAHQTQADTINSPISLLSLTFIKDIFPDVYSPFAHFHFDLHIG